MENTPEAAPQNTGTEATNTNTNQTEVPAEQAKAEVPKEPDTQGFTTEQLAEMKKFMDANGGYDKAFKTFKERISNPAPEAPKEPEAQQQQQPIEQPVKPVVPTGYMSQSEFMAQQYYNSLANQDEYKPIADKIRSGEVFNEMRKFGIQPMDDNGNINDTQAREFLSLLAKTVPATPANDAGEAAAPTVDYVPTNGGKIDSFEQATRIINQSERLRSQNLAEHPDLAAAKEFIKNALTSKKK